MPEPALSEVSGQRARPLAPSAPARPSAHPLCPRGLHAASSVGSAGLAEQGRDLWSVVPRQRRDSAPGRWRPQTSGGGDRILQRVAHLESTIAAPSPCPLRRPGRRPECRPPTLDLRTVRLLSAGQSPQPRFPRQVRGGPPPTPRRRQAGISRCAGESGGASGVRRLAPPAVPLRLGGLFQAPFWRSRACTALSGLLHVVPPGFLLIRNFGFFAHRRLAALLPLCRQLLAAVDNSTPAGGSASISTAATPLWLCPRCGGPMILLERLTPRQARLRSPPMGARPCP